MSESTILTTDGTRRATEHQAVPAARYRLGLSEPRGLLQLATSRFRNSVGTQATNLWRIPFPPCLTVFRQSFGVGDTAPEPSTLDFFNGKPHAEGVKAYRDHLASRRAR
jgi:hypothetical protein